MTGIYIKELRIIGTNKKPAAINFTKGPNLISGPSNTGKTFIFELLEYMLGASAIDRRIRESNGYE